MSHAEQRPAVALCGKDRPVSAGPANIAARFLQSALRYADRPALGMAGETQALTYHQAAKRMLSLARRLEPLKVGHPVGLLSENRPEWGLAYLAILTCGGMVVPIDPQLKDDELRGLIAESKIDRLLVSTRFGERAKRVAKTLTTSIEIINLESVTDDNDDEFCVDSGDHPDRPAVMIFTSGTTGSAKKVILTHGNLLSNIEGIMARLPLATDDCYLSVLPLHHTFEATCGLLVPLLQGVAVYYVSEINSREILKGIAKHQITRFISVPLLFEKMYHGILNGIRKAALPKRAAFEAALLITKGIYYLFHVNVGHTLFRPFWKRAGLHTIRLMVSGGAPLPLEIARNFNLMGFHFVEGYGLTEAAPVVSVNPPWRVKFGSVGPPLDNVEVRIDSPDERGVGSAGSRGDGHTGVRRQSRGDRQAAGERLAAQRRHGAAGWRRLPLHCGAQEKPDRDRRRQECLPRRDRGRADGLAPDH